jgi:hypothetical protein
MALTLVSGPPGSHDLTAFILAGSLVVKLNTLDVTLIDPNFISNKGATITLTNPAWVGTQISSSTTDPVDLKNSHQFQMITATNASAAPGGASPFDLSDTPNNSTTYGYRGLSVKTTNNLDGTQTVAGTCTINQGGYLPGMTFKLTSANQGISAVTYTIQQVTTRFIGIAIPIYQIDFGDPIVTLRTWATGLNLGRTRQVPTEAVLVSGVDASAGGIIDITLTAARLVGAPLNMTVGQRLTFIFTEGGIGGFGVTWNAVFKLLWSNVGDLTGKVSSTSFIWNGTNWIQDGAQVVWV